MVTKGETYFHFFPTCGSRKSVKTSTCDSSDSSVASHISGQLAAAASREKMKKNGATCGCRKSAKAWKNGKNWRLAAAASRIKTKKLERLKIWWSFYWYISPNDQAQTGRDGCIQPGNLDTSSYVWCKKTGDFFGAHPMLVRVCV